MDSISHQPQQNTIMEKQWHQHSILEQEYVQQMAGSFQQQSHQESQLQQQQQQHLWPIPFMAATVPQPNSVLYSLMPVAEQKPRLSREQWIQLERFYSQDKKPTTQFKRNVAQSMAVPIEKINNWFQNRRAKEKQEAKKAEAAEADESSHEQSCASESPERSCSRSADRSVTPTASETVKSISSSPQRAVLLSPSPEIVSSTEDNMAAARSIIDSEFTRTAQSCSPSDSALSEATHEGLSHPQFYPSPDQTDIFSPFEEKVMMMQQQPSSSMTDSTKVYENVMVGSFTEALPGNKVMPVMSGDPQLSGLFSNEIPIPSLAFSDNHTSSALTYDDFAPWTFDQLASLPQTPTYPSTLDSAYSTEGTPLGCIAASSELSVVPEYAFLSSFGHEAVNASRVSLPTLSDQPYTKMNLLQTDFQPSLKLRQSSQPNLASRRRKPAPAAIGIDLAGSMSRAGSYMTGTVPPSPRSPRLGTLEHPMHRIKSFSNAAGRIQKPITPVQKSPMALSFIQQQLLLTHQTPPPSASINEDAHAQMNYNNVHTFFPSSVNSRDIPFSAPPTQSVFTLPSDTAFSGMSVLPLDIAPTTQSQRPHWLLS